VLTSELKYEIIYKMEIQIPDRCPTCNSVLEMVNDQLFCRSTTCPAKSLKGLIHYAKTVKIMGLGEKTLEKLETNTINDLYNYTIEDLTTKLGDKIGTKLFNEIDNSTQTTITKFLNGMGVPLIGKTASAKIDSVVNTIEEINAETCKEAGLGAKATDNLVNWVNTEYAKYQDLPIEFQESEPVASGQLVCISGKIPGYTKAKIKELLLDFNIAVKDSLTKDVDYLISNETGTTKTNKAEQYNIQVISFDNFMEKINE
jgi:DNA ligase (NAD+)